MILLHSLCLKVSAIIDCQEYSVIDRVACNVQDAIHI